MVFPKQRILQHQQIEDEDVAEVNAKEAEAPPPPVHQEEAAQQGLQVDCGSSIFNQTLVQLPPIQHLPMRPSILCPITPCMASFTTVQGVQIHMGKIHANLVPNKATRANLRRAGSSFGPTTTFRCPRCYLLFRSYQGLVHHIVCRHRLSVAECEQFTAQYATFQGPYSCTWPNCPISCSSLTTLRRHVSRRHW